MLPKSFNDAGFLPEDYEVTFTELRESLLVLGPEELRSTWDVTRRSWLVNNLEILVRQLWAIGIERIFVNGSFVTEKDKPCDILELRSQSRNLPLFSGVADRRSDWRYPSAIPGCVSTGKEFR